MAGAVTAIVAGIAAVARAIISAVVAVSGAKAVTTAGLLMLKAVGFTAAGPAAGSYAAGWMSSIATANGGGVAAHSLFSVVQSLTMRGVAVLGAPVISVAGAVAVAAAWFFRR